MTSKRFVEELIAAPFTDPYVPKHQLGPDYIIPTTDNRTWKADGVVRINLERDNDPRFKPISVISLLRQAVDNSPYSTALMIKRNNVLLKWTYKQYWQDVRTVAKGFIKLGLTPFKATAILGYNSPEWAITYLAAIFCGGFPTGIYTTNSADACLHILEDSSADIVAVDTKQQLDKILSIRHKLPKLKAIIQFDEDSYHPDVVSWQDLLRIGHSVPDEILEKRIKGIAINQCCNLVYTSGTTGHPKGVMITHDSVIYMIKTMYYNVRETQKQGKTVSYLPLSHVAALVIDFYGSIFTESSVYFANPDALKGKLVDDLIEAKPTFFLGVPRVYEKIMEKLETTEETLPLFKKILIQWARKQAFTHYQNQNSNPMTYLIAQKLILRKVKLAMGMQYVSDFVSGGAPISRDVIQFFRSFDINIREAYGLSECSGAHVVTTPEKLFRLGSVGNTKILKNLEVKILNPDADGSGEIMIRGRNIFMGYLGLEETTKEALEETKWLHTGDCGLIDKDGFLFITGRIKEILITSGGENIPPLVIEERIKKLLTVVSNCMVVGDMKKYLIILLTLKTELDPNTLEPVDKLNSAAINWCKSVGSDVMSVSRILQTRDSNIMRAIQEGIDEYNEKFAMSRAQKIQKWAILPQDFCIQNGTLGPTSKLKRPFVIKKYHDIIENTYLS